MGSLKPGECCRLQQKHDKRSTRNTKFCAKAPRRGSGGGRGGGGSGDGVAGSGLRGSGGAAAVRLVVQVLVLASVWTFVVLVVVGVTIMSSIVTPVYFHHQFDD